MIPLIVRTGAAATRAAAGDGASAVGILGVGASRPRIFLSRKLPKRRQRRKSCRLSRRGSRICQRPGKRLIWRVLARLLAGACRFANRAEPNPVPIPPRKAFPSLAVEARGLACERGGRPVFAELNFRVGAGKLMAITGPNGSGKSSLLRIIAGLLRPTAGSFAIVGASEDAAPTHFLGHAEALKAAFSVRETLAFWTALHDGANDSTGALAGAAEIVGLAHALDLPVGVLSAGQRRRAGLARLLIAPRPLWLLDEPTAALDQEGGALLRRLMADHLAAGGLILAATHHRLPIMPDRELDLGGET
jgi:heme exporter protein A